LQQKSKHNGKRLPHKGLRCKNDENLPTFCKKGTQR